MFFLQTIGTILVALAALGCAYHLLLALVAVLRPREEQCVLGERPVHSFAIVVPAHNEETTIEPTLRSCEALDYPCDQVAVYVVADNCDDNTAEVAGRGGAICLIRKDETRRGKGFALEWALPQVLAAGHDAVLVLDADCLIDARSLRVVDHRLSMGDRVLQLNNVVGNPDESSMSLLLATANRLENDFFYAPKSRLGLAVLLRGTGMAMHRRVLEMVPWTSHSVTEDAEYSFELLEAGIPIRFVQNARVLSAFPVEHGQLSVQRSRWIGGGVALARRQSFRMLARGVTRRRLPLLDAGLTVLLLSRPLIILQLLLTVAVCAATWMVSPDSWSVGLLFSSIAVMAGYLVYAVGGAASLGVSSHRLKLLLSAPWIVIRYLWLGLVTVTVGTPTAWNKTPRLPGMGKL